MSALSVRARIERRGVDLDLDLADGEVLAVLGPNGAGKSTLLSLIAGLVRPDHGTVMLGDATLTDTAAGVFVPPHARGVALLSQRPLLFPHLSAAANVAFAPRSRGTGRAASRVLARQWLQAVDAEDLARRRPARLSGGQAQRVAIARALAAEPRLLLLDEPMSALDVTAAPVVRRLLRTVLREQSRTAVIVTHDLLDALALADRVAIVDAGRIVESGTVRSVLTSPRSAFGARIAGVDLLAGTMAATGSLETPWGTTVSGIEEPGGDLHPGAAAVALFRPAAVAVHLEPPHASPRNALPVTIAEMEVHGTTVRVRGAENPDGSAGLAADVTAAAVADLDLAPGRQVYFVVKTQEVELHPALPAPAG
ncbi:sulfate/molybdate ABC transporter ATP-binding protein [Rhodococcus tukisamuensis]|uniref:Molybdate transport system ATP-binding protein n=1 Tax=Rhodococcus tukisamuensis TaxID=168276 RepID=A0A1G6WCS2_9NOCA|nr:ATP-binding cassette domain-containing protein [Rhodococcus tukisamuensis]SDD63483.1 molybdate transport system ATP-binding protein [Rhodococcus tukisamuensis]